MDNEQLLIAIIKADAKLKRRERKRRKQFKKLRRLCNAYALLVMEENGINTGDKVFFPMTPMYQTILEVSRAHFDNKKGVVYIGIKYIDRDGAYRSVTIQECLEAKIRYEKEKSNEA